MYFIESMAMIIMIKNNENDQRLLLLSAFIILIIALGISTHHAKFDEFGNKKIDKQEVIIRIGIIIIISVIVLLDTTGLSIMLFLAQVGEATINNSTKVGLGFAVINCVLYVILVNINYAVLNLYSISVVTINFAITYIATFTVRREIIEKGRAQLISKELQAKSKELERAYEKLQELYEEKAEVTILKERNRIAGEIHDTVGHILTTVRIQLEASKRLIKKDPDLALEKLNSAQQQVKTGLHDIRKSVRALNEGEDLISFVDLLKAFIAEIEKNSDVTIQYNFSEMPALDKELQNIIYRALQEGITNGIRHGKSKRFEIALNYEDNRIRYSIKDMGKGFEEIKLGFGLHNMKAKVESVGGIFKIQSVVNDGVTIYIEIPVAG
jgi:signal transduction histidine kinase